MSGARLIVVVGVEVGAGGAGAARGVGLGGGAGEALAGWARGGGQRSARCDGGGAVRAGDLLLPRAGAAVDLLLVGIGGEGDELASGVAVQCRAVRGAGICHPRPFIGVGARCAACCLVRLRVGNVAPSRVFACGSSSTRRLEARAALSVGHGYVATAAVLVGACRSSRTSATLGVRARPGCGALRARSLARLVRCSAVEPPGPRCFARHLCPAAVERNEFSAG